MAYNRPWTEIDIEVLREEYPRCNGRAGLGALAERLGRTVNGVRCKADSLGLTMREKPAEPDTVNPARAFTGHAHVLPETAELLAEIERLNTLNARLTEQLAWAQRGHSATRTGGVLTFRISDEHFGDANHLARSCDQVWAKFVVLVEQYRPDLVQLIWLDDLIPGRGIYREQDLDSVTSDPDEQCKIGGALAASRVRAVREVTDAPIKSIELRGNHSYVHGTSVHGYLRACVEKACRGLGVEHIEGDDLTLVDLAAEGGSNILVAHGFGHSSAGPNGGAFVNAMKDKLIVLSRQLDREQMPRRVASGHTHWLSVGLEHVEGLPFDTTGGFQRNTRVKLGMNQRPSGAIAYVSLPGMSDILSPIPVTPDSAVYQSEIESKTLRAENQQRVARTALEWSRLESGEAGPVLPGLVVVGR